MERLDGQARLLGVAKIGLQGRAASERVIRETELVTRLGPGVRASGARLPDARVIRLPSGCPVMVQTPIEGRPMDTLLARGRLAFGAFAERLTNWLERWNGATRTVQVIDRAWLDRELLVPAARVALRLTGCGLYLESLRARCAAVEGEALPLVAAHCDLTASNLLDTPGGELGVIDWEASQDAGLPLRDLVYCLVDAAWAAGGRGSRSQSFGDCFEPGGKFRAVIRQNQERLCRSLGLSETLAALCFHACWVQHAADEVAEGTAMEPGPFLRIVERLARERERAPS